MQGRHCSFVRHSSPCLENSCYHSRTSWNQVKATERTKCRADQTADSEVSALYWLHGALQR